MDIFELLIKHEGFKLMPYTDTVGKLTIGIGRNLTDRGISKEEAMFLLKNDVEEVEAALNKFSWFNELNDVRKMAITDMAFNLGMTKFLQFKWMIDALIKKDYKAAAIHMRQSKWATQVKGRSVELAAMVEEGA